MPFYFQFLTLLAFHIFLQERVSCTHTHTHAEIKPECVLSGISVPQVDLAVIEVGIGGQYDCTNIIR